MHLFCFGLGYVGERLARALIADGWTVTGTTRDPDKAARLAAIGIVAHVFDNAGPGPELAAALASASHVLASIPPRDDVAAPDPALTALGVVERDAPPSWIGYLSTTGVYGDAGGGWVDEATPVAPIDDRARRRVAAEAGWTAYHQRTGAPVDLMRLAGIYGPGRSALDAVRNGRARRIVKPGQFSSRVHVDDIVAAIRACMARPIGLRIFNVCDDEPAPPQDVIGFVCALLGSAPPPEEPFDGAAMSRAARGFYAASKRVGNARLKAELGWAPRYPGYRSGLTAIARAEHADRGAEED